MVANEICVAEAQMMRVFRKSGGDVLEITVDRLMAALART